MIDKEQGFLLEESLKGNIPAIIDILSKNYDVLIKLTKDKEIKIMLVKPIKYRADI